MSWELINSFKDLNFVLVYWIYKSCTMRQGMAFSKMLCLEEVIKYFLFIMRITVV